MISSNIKHLVVLYVTERYPCILYSPTFTININQMQENLAYMDGTGVVHFCSKFNAVFPMTR